MAELPPLIEQLQQAINRGDWPGFIACFHPDAVVNDWGSVYAGTAEIKAWSDRELIGAKGTLAITEVVSSAGGITTLDTQWTSSFFTGPGRFTIAIRDGKISELRIGEL